MLVCGGTGRPGQSSGTGYLHSTPQPPQLPFAPRGLRQGRTSCARLGPSPSPGPAADPARRPRASASRRQSPRPAPEQGCWGCGSASLRLLPLRSPARPELQPGTWPRPPAPRPHLCSCPPRPSRTRRRGADPGPPLAHRAPPPTRDCALWAGAAPRLHPRAHRGRGPAAAPACGLRSLPPPSSPPRHLPRRPAILLCPPPSGPPAPPRDAAGAPRTPLPGHGRNSLPPRPLPTGSTPPSLSGGGSSLGPTPSPHLGPPLRGHPGQGRS